MGIQHRYDYYAEDVWDTYWFEKNLQGDIVKVYNHSGALLISYTYDAWGNATISYSNNGQYTNAAHNPFRYNSIRRRIL